MLPHKPSPGEANTPRLIAVPQRAARLRQSLPALSRRLRIHEIRETFRFSQINLSVFESAPGKFTRLREPQAKRRKRIQTAANHRPAAMNMKLRHILACKAGRSWKPKHEAAIQNLARLRMTKRSKPGKTRSGDVALAQNAASAFRAHLARYPYDGDPARPGAVESA